jgi:glycosyltransferase involved in cell wall biosynthesis
LSSEFPEEVARVQQLPRVSVMLAVKDEEEYVEACIDGLARQEGVELEAVFIDDGSTDRTWEILQKAAAEHPWLKPRRNLSPGKVNAFNYAYASATGDYLCLFAGDDIMVANTLRERAVPLMALPGDRPAVSMCKLKTFSTERRYDGHVVPRDPNRGNTSGQCLMFNRGFGDLLFPIPNVLPSEDTWSSIFLRFVEGIQLFHVPVVACLYRIHEGNSMNRFVKFDQFTHLVHARAAAYAAFLERKRNLLTESAAKRVEALAKAEEYRFAGKTLRILRQPGLEIRDRLRVAMRSNGVLYAIRNQLWGLFSGR